MIDIRAVKMEHLARPDPPWVGLLVSQSNLAHLASQKN